MFWNFFKRLAKAEAVAEQKEAEAQFYRDCFTSASEEISRLNKLLDQKTRSNQKREDDLLNQLLKAKQVALPTPRMELVQEIEVENDSAPDNEFESQVNMIAEQFRQEALNRGMAYNEADMIAIKESIRQNPKDYF